MPDWPQLADSILVSERKDEVSSCSKTDEFEEEHRQEKNSKMSQSDLRNPSTHQLRLQRFCIGQISPSLAVHSNSCSQKHHSLNLPPEQERLR